MHLRVLLHSGESMWMKMSAEAAADIIRRWVGLPGGAANDRGTIFHPPDFSFAFMAKDVAGMYLVEERQSAADRLADVMEREASRGEEWRGE